MALNIKSCLHEDTHTSHSIYIWISNRAKSRGRQSFNGQIISISEKAQLTF